MRLFLLFVVACFLGGLGGALGSMVGNAFGSKATLFAGGLLGGLMIAPLTARLAVWRRWVAPDRYWTTAAGAAAGFLAAAVVAMNTLSSPAGPVASTALIGLGAVIGGRSPRRDGDRAVLLPGPRGD